MPGEISESAQSKDREQFFKDKGLQKRVKEKAARAKPLVEKRYNPEMSALSMAPGYHALRRVKHA